MSFSMTLHVPGGVGVEHRISHTGVLLSTGDLQISVFMFFQVN